MAQTTGFGGIGLSYTDECYGEAFERAKDESEFGLPGGYDDPHAYRGKSPACEPVIGYGR
jgi:hypothetical protein